jgi:hypothetical protein
MTISNLTYLFLQFIEILLALITSLYIAFTLPIPLFCRQNGNYLQILAADAILFNILLFIYGNKVTFSSLRCKVYQVCTRGYLSLVFFILQNFKSTLCRCYLFYEIKNVQFCVFSSGVFVYNLVKIGHVC